MYDLLVQAVYQAPSLAGIITIILLIGGFCGFLYGFIEFMGLFAKIKRR